MRERCLRRFLMYVPMPKSWSFRASIAIRTVGILAGIRREAGIRDPGSDGLPIPPGPFHPVLPPELSNGPRIDVAAARGLDGLVHALLDLAGCRLHVVHPAEAVVLVADRGLDAVGDEQREPGTIAAGGHGAGDAQLRAALPVGIHLVAGARNDLHLLLEARGAPVARRFALRR